MATFSSDDIDIDPSEYIESCSKREIEELIQELKSEGYIPNNTPFEGDEFHFTTFEEALENLKGNGHLLTTEEEQTIIKLSEKFKY